MLKTTMIWERDSGGSEEVSSGTDSANAIQSITITECVNSGEELTLGSVCASMIEAKILAPAGGLEIHAGSEITVYRHDGAKTHLVGGYIMEKPTRPTANTVKITGYDFVTKLDKDLTAWLNSLTGWPYKLLDFAGMVCNACGLSLANTEIPNGDFLVQKFTRDSVTGRQLMQWIGELSCRFCRINRDNPAQLEFAWYEPSGKSIAASGDMYYFQNSLTFEDYATAPVDAVQMRLAESDSGAVWPVVPETYNRYVITGNPLLNGSLQADIEPVLNTILAELDGFTYTPCKVSVPANMDLRAGHTVTVTDKNGKSFTTCIMTKTQAGQKDVLECTGSYRRDTASASSAQASSASAAAAAASAAQSAKAAQNAAQKAVDSLTQQEIFDKLTDNGKIQGIYLQDGKWYINAELAKIVNLIADHVKSISGPLTMEIDGAKLVLRTNGSENIVLTNEFAGYPIFRMANTDGEDLYFGQMCSLQTNEFRLGGNADNPMFRVGANLLTGNSEVYLGSLFPSGTGNCKWEYIPSLGKTVLVQQ